MNKENLAHLLQWYLENNLNNIYEKDPQKSSSEKLLEKKASMKSSTLISNSTHPADSCQNLEQLKEAMLNYTGCLLKDTAMNMVFSDGNPQAKIMFVGEAPGAEEDRQGKPFVGQSGQLLDRMLNSINLDRTQVYISNIIPWRPPGNRPPNTAEIAACQPFIQKHIELIQPKILVLVGGIATKTLLATTLGIVKLRGKWHSYSLSNGLSETKVIATFHPAYLLRSPGQKALSWKDFLLIEQALNNLS